MEQNFAGNAKCQLTKIDTILYCNKEKSQELFRVLGLQFPKGVNNLSFNCIIHQSRNIVNTQNENSEKNKEEISLTNEELIKALSEQLGKNNYCNN